MFALCKRIPKEKLKRLNNMNVYIIGMTIGAAAHELFFADLINETVRCFDLQSEQFDATEAYRVERGESVRAVTYSAESDTLLVGTYSDSDNIIVRSFARTNSTGEWRLSDQRDISCENPTGAIKLSALRDGTLVCGQLYTNGVHVSRVQSDRTMQNFTRVTLPTSYNGLDVRMVDNEKHLAAALMNRSVALYRLEENRVVELSRVSPLGRRRVLLRSLFVGDKLLVQYSNGRYSRIKAISITGTTLDSEDVRPLYKSDEIEIDGCCFENGKLYAWDIKSGDLFEYNGQLKSHKKER